MTGPELVARATFVSAAIRRLEHEDWAQISRQEFGTDLYADWCHGRCVRHLLREQGFCETCGTVAQRPPAPAVARWVHANGNATQLCATCLGHWEANAAEDPSMAPARLDRL